MRRPSSSTQRGSSSSSPTPRGRAATPGPGRRRKCKENVTNSVMDEKCDLSPIREFLVSPENTKVKMRFNGCLDSGSKTNLIRAKWCHENIPGFGQSTLRTCRNPQLVGPDGFPPCSAWADNSTDKIAIGKAQESTEQLTFMLLRSCTLRLLLASTHYASLVIFQKDGLMIFVLANKICKHF